MLQIGRHSFLRLSIDSYIPTHLHMCQGRLDIVARRTSSAKFHAAQILQPISLAYCCSRRDPDIFHYSKKYLWPDISNSCYVNSHSLFAVRSKETSPQTRNRTCAWSHVHVLYQILIMANPTAASPTHPCAPWKALAPEVLRGKRVTKKSNESIRHFLLVHQHQIRRKKGRG